MTAEPDEGDGRVKNIGVDLAHGEDRTVHAILTVHGHYKADGLDMCAICDDDWPCAFVSGWKAAVAAAVKALNTGRRGYEDADKVADG